VKLTYNFKLGPEAIWLIVNTVIGTVLVELLANLANLSTLPGWGDLQLWAGTLGVSAVRTLIGALLAAATSSGGFNQPDA
jgi:hypothetical protein